MTWRQVVENQLDHPDGWSDARFAELAAKRERIRAELGVDCLGCHDTGIQIGNRTRNVPCGCERGREVAARQAEAQASAYQTTLDGELGIPARFNNLTFETFSDPDALVLARVRGWVEGGASKPGLYLAGPAGRGKSVLAAIVLRTLVLRRAESQTYEVPAGRIGAFAVVTSLLEQLRRFDDGLADATLDRMQAVRWLVLDDLGAERLTDWGADRLFEIVNARHNEGRALIITSNLDLDGLAANVERQVGPPFGSRLVSRLVESCDMIVFRDDDPDWRLQAVRGATDVRT